MNNEETKVFNPSEETVVNNVADTKKKSVINDKVAFAAGGFAAGLASGVAGSAFAANSEEVDMAAVVEAEEPTPESEEVLMATDEGVRIAQVDDSASFAEAFADARAQVGPGGAFEWRGHVYNTYYAEEWNSMSAEERAEYQSKIDYSAISGDTTDTVESYEPAVAEAPEADMNMLAADTEMVDEQPTDEGIRVLGVEAVVDEYGNPMTAAFVEMDGQEVMLVDEDHDGTMDLLVADVNGDEQIDPYQEIEVISDCEIGTEDLMQNMEMQDGDTFLAYNDDMPDYMNDADVSAMA